MVGKTGKCADDVTFEIEPMEDILHGLQTKGHAALADMSGEYPEFNDEMWTVMFAISGPIHLSTNQAERDC